MWAGVTATDEFAISKSTVLLSFDKVKDGQLRGSFCTGSLISSNTILTAAHCIYGATNGRIIFSKRHDSLKPNDVVTRKAKQMIINHLYDDAKIGLGDAKDTAMIRFEGVLPAGYSPIKIMEFADAKNYLKSGVEVHLAGFGETGVPSLDRSSIMNLRDVRTAFAGVNQNANYELVFGNGACHGDSGGPAYLLINSVPYLIGVAAWVTQPTHCTGQSIYTSFYRNQF